jgi:hypothetical protein
LINPRCNKGVLGHTKAYYTFAKFIRDRVGLVVERATSGYSELGDKSHYVKISVDDLSNWVFAFAPFLNSES